MIGPKHQKKIEITFILVVSTLLHLMFAGGLKLSNRPDLARSFQPVKVHLVEKKKPELEITPDEKPQPKLKKESVKKPKPPETRTPKKKPVKEATKVQGVTTESTVENSLIAVPLGNTLMKEDLGKRLSPDELASLEKDLSSDALLIQGSFVVPNYTQGALDANLEGKFIVDVFVNVKGDVLDTELRKKIGYGLDELVLNASRSARFFPRKNAKGMPIPGWSEIVFYLEIP